MLTNMKISIKKEPVNKSFEVFNVNRTKNREVTRFALLELEINRHIKINTAVTNLNSMDIFLEYNWLVKHNPKLNQNKGTIQFMKYPKECRAQH